ncbi:HAMP domain-containing protein [Candidatus Latescibacterota bacterium]
MTRTPTKRHFLKRAAAYLRRLSIRRKITIVILLSFILILPTALLSLHYQSRILQEITVIIEQDVTLGRYASDLSMIMLDIRRNERNYRLIGSSTERDAVESGFVQARDMLGHARDIARQSDQPIIQNLLHHLALYEESFDLLTDHITTTPPEERIIQLESQLETELGDFQKRYHEIMGRLETASPAERDSLIALVNDAMDAISFERLVSSGVNGDNSAQPVYIQDNLNRSAQEFLGAAQVLAEQSWQNMHEHRTESLSIEARATRNIIMVMIFTGFLYLWMVTVMPRQIIKPITQLNALIKKAGEGDFRGHARQYSNDEIGDLASTYNNMLDRIWQYDELKTKKISSQKRMIDRLLDMLPVPVCLLSANLVLFYYNQAFVELFGGVIPPKPPDMGLEVVKFEHLRQFVEEIQLALSGTKTEFVIQLESQDGTTHRFRGRLIRNAMMEQESVVLLGEPPISPEEHG